MEVATIVERAEQEQIVLPLIFVRNCSYLSVRSYYKKYEMDIPDWLDNRGIWIWI